MLQTCWADWHRDETSDFVHEIIIKLEGRILVIIKGEIKLVVLTLFYGVYLWSYQEKFSFIFLCENIHFKYCGYGKCQFRTLCSILFRPKFFFSCSCYLKYLKWNGKQCRPWSDCSSGSSLIWVCTVCICHFVRNFGVSNFRAFTVLDKSARFQLVPQFAFDTVELPYLLY